jgi:hypothetical protein
VSSSFWMRPCFYGVGAGEAVPSAGEAVSEGDASVAGAFFLAAAFFFRAGDGVGDALAVAAVVEVAVVPCCDAQEAINAMPITTAIKGKTDFFIDFIKVKSCSMFAPHPDSKQITLDFGAKVSAKCCPIS